MASQPPPAAAAAAPPSAQVVGNAFVHQYYHILHQSPDLVYRFYQDSSKLGRPAPLGTMDTVSTMQAINDKILSMDYSDFRAEIKTVDAQESLNGGVLVLVTGYLTGKDNVRRNFTQSFFLATQDKGYFVLNDLFRYVEDGNQAPAAASAASAAAVATPSDQEAPLVQEETPAPATPEEEEEVHDGEVYEAPEDHAEGSTIEEEEPQEEVIDEVPESSPPPAVAETSSTATAAATTSNSQEEVPKKSYASIVKVKKENVTPLSVPPLVPAPAKPAPVNPERQAPPAPTLVSAPDVPLTSNNITETRTIQEADADGHSIYVKSLPMNATPDQLEEEFKRFGPIKPDGIQVRSHKLQGFCFGFVEFEVASAVQSAIEASPLSIGGRQVYIEEKRPAGSRVSNRGRFLPGRGGGFRNDGARGRGGYGAGRSYGRGDYGGRADFGGRGGRGIPNRGGEGGYQRVDTMGSTGGRGSRSGSVTPNASPRVPASA